MPLGNLRSWYSEKYKVSSSFLSFDDRAAGEVLEEFYIEASIKADELRSSFDTLSAEEQKHLQNLEDLLSGNEERSALYDLNEEESNDVWLTAHKTGDPLADKWEREIANGQTPDLNEAP